VYWRGARFVGVEHGFDVGHAGGQMEGYEDANALWRKGFGPEGKDGAGGDGARARMMAVDKHGHPSCAMH